MSTRVSADVGIELVEPLRRGQDLLCHLHLRGLPDPDSRETLESGLPSSLVLGFGLLDGRDRELGRSRVEIRIVPSLWEEEIMVHLPTDSLRLRSLSELGDLLSHLGPIPVLPVRGPTGRGLRLKVRLAIHPLAPAEMEKARGLILGDTDPSGEERREVSIGFSALLRWAFGSSREERWVAEGTSGAFDWAALPEARPR